MASVATATETVAPALRTKCADMERLRAEAKHLQEKLRTSRQRAREHEKQERREGGRLNHSSDYEQFFQRKLLKHSLRIARHIAEHGCEELGKDR